MRKERERRELKERYGMKRWEVLIGDSRGETERGQLRAERGLCKREKRENNIERESREREREREREQLRER